MAKIAFIHSLKTARYLIIHFLKNDSWLKFQKYLTSRVQTFNSHTSKLDICQCLVVQTPMDNVSKDKLNTSMTHVAMFSCEVIHASMPRKLGGSQVCGCVFFPALPTHLVQELNVSTAAFNLRARPGVNHTLIFGRTAKNSSPGGRAAFPASLPIPWLALLKKIP